MIVIVPSFCTYLEIALIRRTEYDDNSQFNNLETLIVQNSVNTVYTHGLVEKGKLQHIAKLLEQLEVKLCIVKKKQVVIINSHNPSDFSSGDAEHELSVLVGDDNLNLYPSILNLKNAMKSAYVLISVGAEYIYAEFRFVRCGSSNVQNLHLCSGNYVGKYTLVPYSINQYTIQS